ncbi:MAG: serine protease [Gammaproteobacteria bacterium]|nr:serine protease [Gammaproteobacteria bacterium]
MKRIILSVMAINMCAFGLGQSAIASLADTIEKIKPSIVGVCTHQTTRRPGTKLMGTGFAVGNGTYFVTNAHVLPEVLDEENKETLCVIVGTGESAKVRPAKQIQIDHIHDLALIAISGEPVPAMVMGHTEKVREGDEIAFTGFPIGAVLGVYPVTHRGIVSAISPVAIPVVNPKDLDVRMIRRLRDPFDVFQLDATAYPGNSGSPVYHVETGKVVGVINKVFVKETKEKILENPSGITYAIPVSHVRQLLEDAKIPY